MKNITAFVVCIIMVICGGLAFAQVGNLNEPGWGLVYPFVETAGIYYDNTLIKIANRSDNDITLMYQAFNERRDTADPCDFVFKDGIIELTGKEVFYWNVRRGVFPGDEGESDNFIAGMPDFQGVIMISAYIVQTSIATTDGSYLIGSAVLVDNAGAAAQYNAIPAGLLAVPVQSDVNSAELQPFRTGRIYFEGFTANAFGLPFEGLLAVTTLAFVHSNNSTNGDGTDPGFDINLDVSNENEWRFSRHFDFCFFEVFNLTDPDVNLTRTALGGNVFQAALTSNVPVFAVFVQDITLPAGEFDWATNVWQERILPE